jgi:hypothetical protein
LLNAGASQAALAAYLDGLDAAQRVQEVRGLSGKQMGALFERCADAAPLTLEDLVPPAVAPGQAVVFAGKNSLPMFSLFEKRFTRLSDGMVAGYNHQPMSAFTGPGYFLVTPAERGELLFDYTQVPARDQVPAGWPEVRDNDGLISRFVYKDLHDFMRRVSQDVLIGHATRLGRPMPQYFILSRARVM